MDRAYRRCAVWLRLRCAPTPAGVDGCDDEHESFADGGFEQIVAGAQPPPVVVEVGVECHGSVGARLAQLGDGSDRRRGADTVEGGGDGPQVHVDRGAGRRGAGEQLGERCGLDPPLRGGMEQQATGDVESGVLEVQRRPTEVVVDDLPEVLGQPIVVERPGSTPCSARLAATTRGRSSSYQRRTSSRHGVDDRVSVAASSPRRAPRRSAGSVGRSRSSR